MHDAWLWMALAFYALGILLIVPSVVRRRPALSPASLGALGVGLAAHAVALARQRCGFIAFPSPTSVAHCRFMRSW